MAKMNIAGIVSGVQQLSGNDENAIFAITIGERNQYKNKTGEHAGKYGRTFIQSKFFADTPKKVAFVKQYIQPRVESKEPVTAELEYRNNNYVDKNGEQVYNNEFVMQQINLGV